MKRKLYCDIDNTVACQYLRIKKNIHKNKNYILENENLLLQDKIVNNSLKVIKKLEKDFEIHWLSARPKKLFNITKKWLEKKKFTINSLNLVDNHDEKISFLKSSKVDLYIDDMKYNYFNLKPLLMTNFISKLKKINIKYFIFNNNWNQILKKIYENNK